MTIFLRIFLSTLFVMMPSVSSAQELFNEYRATYHGKVLEFVSEEMRELPGLGTEHLFQEIRIEILDGERKGEMMVIENDYLKLDTGDKFYMNYSVLIDGREVYAVVRIDRTSALISLVAVFVIAVIAFGGWQGVRSLVALAGSFGALFYILMPGLLAGWNPLLASFAVAGAVLFGAIFFTHGFNRESLVAYSGTMISVFLTGIFAVIAVAVTDLSGFATEESVYLNFNTEGSLDFVGLLLGAIIIGVLGVLDDIAVTQSAVVTELFRADRGLSRRAVYLKALRVGREHVGALVNTLVLAYTGASLPLLLYFYLSPSNFSASVNTELFATEIVRTIVGSVGLIMTVPIVTLLAVWYLKDYAHTHPHTHSHGHGHGHHHG